MYVPATLTERKQTKQRLTFMKITKEQVVKAQQEWGRYVIKIGSLKENRPECEKLTEELISRLYGYDLGIVLFKPTLASEKQFRGTAQGARSYMIGGDESFPEDGGFALKPWTEVRFENTGIILGEEEALAMGNYFFTDENGEETKVEYSFGYKKDDEGNLRIILHHSSLPYNL